MPATVLYRVTAEYGGGKTEYFRMSYENAKNELYNLLEDNYQCAPDTHEGVRVYDIDGADLYNSITPDIPVSQRAFYRIEKIIAL